MFSMFEIPDDDDLFSEDCLKDIFNEADNKITKVTKNHVEKSYGLADSNHHLTSEPTCNPDPVVRSPLSKRSRILFDVNRQSDSEVIRKDHLGSDKRLINVPVTNSSSAESGPSRVIGIGQGNTLVGTTVDIGQGNTLVRATVGIGQGNTLVETTNGNQPTPELASTVRRRSLRKFPGPAGMLPPVKLEDVSLIVRKNVLESPEVVLNRGQNPLEHELTSSQANGEPFGGASWLQLLSDLQPGVDEVLKKFSLQAMMHKAGRHLLPKGKVPLLLGVLDSIDFHALDASVVVKDPTGQMQGTLHREVLKEFGPELQVGAAIILRQVSVISPSPRTHYLNITAGNVVAIYPAGSPRIGNSALPSSSPSCREPGMSTTLTTRPCREAISSYVQAAEVELLQAANAAQESALSRLREKQQLTTARSEPALSSSAGGGHSLLNKTSPALFVGYRMPHIKSSPGFSQGAAALPVPATPQTAADKRFTFKSGEVRTPTAGPGGTGCRQTLASPNTPECRMKAPASAGNNSDACSSLRGSNPGSLRWVRVTEAPTLLGLGANCAASRGNPVTFEQSHAVSPFTNSSGNRTVNPTHQILSAGVVTSRSCSRGNITLNQPSIGSHLASVPVASDASSGTSFIGDNQTGNGQQNCCEAGISITRHEAQDSSVFKLSKWSFKPGPSIAQDQPADGSVDVSGSKVHPRDAARKANSSVKAASVPRNMWDEELSEDILSQMSDDF